MKALIVLVLGLLLLGGAGFGGWTLYTQYIMKPAEDAEPPPPPKPPSAYVRLKPVVVPLIGENKVEQFVTIVATVQVNQLKQPTAQASIPRLENAALFTMYDLAAEGKVLQGSLVNIPLVKARLLDAMRHVLDGDTVQDLLIQVVMQRSL